MCFEVAFAANAAECDKQWMSNKFGTFYFNNVNTELFAPLITLAPSEAKPTILSQGI